jgi:SPP1 gp7 family putative phage head morphogenesis protein
MTTEAPLRIGFDLPFAEAIKAATIRGVVLPDVYYGDLQGVSRQLAFSIAGIAAYDQLTAVRNSLAQAMATGQSFNSWRDGAAAQNLGLPDYRLQNIWRTNLQGNYERGRYESILRHVDVMPYLMYTAIHDSRTRPSHAAMDGTIRRWDDPWWKTHSPPCSYQCRCSTVQLSERQALRRSQPGADGQPRGLNKQPTLPDGTPAQADPGFDYHPYEDRWQPIRQSLANRAAAPNASTVLGEALAGAIEGSLSALYSAWVADRGVEEAKVMWEKYFKGQELPR